MHEVGLMQEALQIALMHAERNDARQIHALTVRIGPLAGVDVQALRLAFEVVKADTLATEAVLNLEETPIRCWCAKCRQSFKPADCVCRCPRCRQLSADIREGREFAVVSVEVS
jgi:hydrogenase nickel incorporation protein HypA/HybF